MTNEHRTWNRTIETLSGCDGKQCMRVATVRYGLVVVLQVVMTLLAGHAFAAQPVKLVANLEMPCANCATNLADPNGDYSLLNDGLAYADGGGVQSQILTNNTVYTLNTMNTLVNGLVGAGTRTVRMHFYSIVEGVYPQNVLPGCWQGDHDQDQAVNWSVFSSKVSFPAMQVGSQYQYSGFARLDFNVRNGFCDNEIFRFYLRWYNVCIVRTTLTTWSVTSDSCGRQTNYGEANLRGQGGKKGQTYDYGDWRMPFQLTLTK